MNRMLSGPSLAQVTTCWTSTVLWHLVKKFQIWIVDRSTARDFTVCQKSQGQKNPDFRTELAWEAYMVVN